MCKYLASANVLVYSRIYTSLKQQAPITTIDSVLDHELLMASNFNDTHTGATTIALLLQWVSHLVVSTCSHSITSELAEIRKALHNIDSEILVFLHYYILIMNHNGKSSSKFQKETRIAIIS